MIVSLCSQLGELDEGCQSRAGHSAFDDVLVLHHGLAFQQDLDGGFHIFGSEVRPWPAAHQDIAVG